MSSKPTIRSRHIFSWLLLILANTLWACSYVAAKFALRDVSVNVMNALRMVISALVLLPFLIAWRKDLNLTRRDLPQLALLAAIGFVINKILEYGGLSLTTASDVALLITSESIFTAALSWLVLRERFKPLTGPAGVGGCVFDRRAQRHSQHSLRRRRAARRGRPDGRAGPGLRVFLYRARQGPADQTPTSVDNGGCHCGQHDFLDTARRGRYCPAWLASARPGGMARYRLAGHYVNRHRVPGVVQGAGKDRWFSGGIHAVYPTIVRNDPGYPAIARSAFAHNRRRGYNDYRQRVSNIEAMNRRNKGGDKPGPCPATKWRRRAYRVGAGLVPALAAVALGEQ